MRRSIILTAILSTLAMSAQAADGVELAMKSKALAASSTSAISISGTPAKQLQAPFTGIRDPLPELLLSQEQERRGLRGGCEYSAQDGCYDLIDGRMTYRGEREYMPEIDGLKPESMSLDANSCTLKDIA